MASSLMPEKSRLADCERAACRCRPMVERAYRELLEKGQAPGHALDAALVVLRWHHPEVTAAEGAAIVNRWVAGSTH